MTTTTSSKEVIHELLSHAVASLNDDRRTEQRIPYFRSVSVKVNGHAHAAFIREISKSSVGMLHKMKLPLAEVEVLVADQSEGFFVRIERCEPCCEGWYISGGPFVDRE